MHASQMQAAVVMAPSRVRMARVGLPQPGEGELRVRLEGCGICGSNLAAWEGRPWFRYPLAPGELGHEGWGRVEALGPNVRRVQVGDRVAMLSYRAYAEYDLASEEAVVRLPEKLAGKPFPGEALSCALNVFRRAQVEPGQTVAIIGIGFLGAVLTALCARAGANVIAISRRPFALEIAEKLGAAEQIALEESARVLERVKALTAGQGCPRVIEAVGAQATLDLAGELTRERGRLIIAGYHQDGLRQVNLQLWNWRGLDVINAHERSPQVYREGMEAAVDAVVSGRLDPFSLYTHTFPLDELAQGLDAMKQRPGNFLKALVMM